MAATINEVLLGFLDCVYGGTNKDKAPLEAAARVGALDLVAALQARGLTVIVDGGGIWDTETIDEWLSSNGFDAVTSIGGPGSKDWDVKASGGDHVFADAGGLIENAKVTQVLDKNGDVGGRYDATSFYLPLPWAFSFGQYGAPPSLFPSAGLPFAPR